MMLNVINPPSKPNNTQTRHQLAQIQAVIEQAQQYLTLSLKHHLPAIKDVTIQTLLQQKLLELHNKLKSNGELGQYINDVELDRLRQLIKQERIIWLNVYQALIPTLPDGVNKEITTALLKAVELYLERIGKAIDTPISEEVFWHSFRPHVEQQMRQQVDLKIKIDALLATLKIQLTKRYELDNITEEKSYAHPSCFISYAWPLIPDEQHDETWTQSYIYQLAMDLHRAGVNVHMDQLDSYASMDSGSYIQEQVHNNDFIFVMGTRALYHKYYEPQRYTSRTREELAHISDRIAQTPQAGDIVGILISGNEVSSFPQELKQYQITRSFLGMSYLQVLRALLMTLYAPENNNDRLAYHTLWDNWLQDADEPLKKLYSGLDGETICNYYQQHRAEQNQQEQAACVASQASITQLAKPVSSNEQVPTSPYRFYPNGATQKTPSTEQTVEPAINRGLTKH